MGITQMTLTEFAAFATLCLLVLSSVGAGVWMFATLVGHVKRNGRGIEYCRTEIKDARSKFTNDIGSLTESVTELATSINGHAIECNDDRSKMAQRIQKLEPTREGGM